MEGLKTIQIEQIRTSVIQENCYLVYNEEALLVIDPGAEGAKLIQEVTRLGRKSAVILLTHTHYDHIGAVEELRHHYQIPVYVSPLKQVWLSNPILNLSRLGRHDDIANIVVRPAEHEFKLTDYEIDGMKFSVVPIPGHSISSVSFVFDGFVVVGDALFKDSIGHTDSYTDDMQQLLHSITAYLLTLPEEFPVYPGHGDVTTIQHEKAADPPLNQRFIHYLEELRRSSND